MSTELVPKLWMTVWVQAKATPEYRSLETVPPGEEAVVYSYAFWVLAEAVVEEAAVDVLLVWAKVAVVA